MFSQRSRRPRRRRSAFAPRLECMESRQLLAVVMLDPLTQPKFVNPLPNPLDPASSSSPRRRAGPITRSASTQFQQPLGLMDPATGNPLKTTVWGYGTDGQPRPPTPGAPSWRRRASRSPWTGSTSWSTRTASPAPPPAGRYDPALGGSLDDGHVRALYRPVPVVTHLHGGHTDRTATASPMPGSRPNHRRWGLQSRSNGPPVQPPLHLRQRPAGRHPVVPRPRAGHHPAERLRRPGRLLHPARRNDTGRLDNPLNLPAGPYEVPLVIQDRMFYGPATTDDPATPQVEAPGQLYYPSAPPRTTGSRTRATCRSSSATTSWSTARPGRCWTSSRGRTASACSTAPTRGSTTCPSPRGRSSTRSGRTPACSRPRWPWTGSCSPRASVPTSSSTSPTRAVGPDDHRPQQRQVPLPGDHHRGDRSIPDDRPDHGLPGGQAVERGHPERGGAHDAGRPHRSAGPDRADPEAAPVRGDGRIRPAPGDARCRGADGCRREHGRWHARMGRTDHGEPATRRRRGLGDLQQHRGRPPDPPAPGLVPGPQPPEVHGHRHPQGDATWATGARGGSSATSR